MISGKPDLCLQQHLESDVLDVAVQQPDLELQLGQFCLRAHKVARSSTSFLVSPWLWDWKGFKRAGTSEIIAGFQEQPDREGERQQGWVPAGLEHSSLPQPRLAYPSRLRVPQAQRFHFLLPGTAVIPSTDHNCAQLGQATPQSYVVVKG